eukprot:90760_1
MLFIMHSLFLSSFLLLSVSSTTLSFQSLGNTNAKCLDGSPAGFYWALPPPGHLQDNLWVINLSGGGNCHTKANCQQSAQSNSGSSNNWPSAVEKGGGLSDDPGINPDFYNAFKVHVPYCSGDGWTGQRTATYSNWGVYFSGHHIFIELIKWLSRNTEGFFSQTEHLLLTGHSAGGLGTLINIDWLYDKRPAQNPPILKGAPVCGWFTAGNEDEADTQVSPDDFPNFIAGTHGGLGHDDTLYALWDSYVPPACFAAFGRNLAWKCLSVHNLYQYIQAPLFIMQNKYDTNQIEQQFLMPSPSNQYDEDTIDYVGYFGEQTDFSMSYNMNRMMDKGDGLFYPSCYDHGTHIGIGNDMDLITINGQNSSEVVGDWFWDRSAAKIVQDICNNNNNKLPCNPAKECKYEVP